ncbi:hypothetical protein TRIP_B30010 [uncultured Desulfatiglans sp.]|nr:hypothetical protein TRIP_B30010 [uncultured Desulfatiglans sp.]
MMNAALDLASVEERIQQRLLARYREMIHKAIDAFVDALAEDLVSEKKMTLMDITQAISKAKPELLAAILQESIQTKHEGILSQDLAECPICKKKIRRSVHAPRTIETLLGSATVNRPYFYCASCKYGFSPADEALGLSSRKKQHDLQKLALEFLADLPFERASELFFKSTGLSFSDHQMHDLFAQFAEEATAEAVIPSAAEIERRIDTVKGNELFAFELPQQDPAYLPFQVAVILPPIPQPAKLPGNGHTALSPLSGDNRSDLIQVLRSDLSAANDEICTHGLASFLTGR